MGEKSYQNALPDNHQLHWYRIQRVLGQGAFGITYLALDINLDRQVAIKEYMPGQMATRATDLTIQPQSDEHREDFKWGLTRFVEEARTLTKFEHPNLVRVLNVFELHGSAYMVMNYETGESLQQVLKREKTLDERRLIKILTPLLNGLELMHAKGFIHRDIKPGNIFIRTDGSPVLLDFGSARQTRGETDPQAMTTLVSPGYAPIEQYTSKGERQGPWTDIYGMAATLYRTIAGSPPSSATDRSAMLLQGMPDDLKQLSSLMAGRYSEKFLAAIDHALVFKAESRPRSIAAWRAEFAFDESDIDTEPDVAVPGSEAVTDRIDLPHDAATQVSPATVRTKILDRDAKTEPAGVKQAVEKTERIAPPTGQPGKRNLAIIGVALVILIGLGVSLFSGHENPGDKTSDAPAPEAESRPAQASEPVAQEDATSARIAEILALAEADMAELRLMSPKGNNAYERFNEVLALEPENAAATEGLRGISQRYVDLAYGALAKDKLDDAVGYVLRAERIEPPAPGLPAVRQAVSKKLADARLKAEAQKTAEATAPPKAKPKQAEKKKKKSDENAHSAEERVKKALGGT